MRLYVFEHLADSTRRHSVRATDLIAAHAILAADTGHPLDWHLIGTAPDPIAQGLAHLVRAESERQRTAGTLEEG